MDYIEVTFQDGDKTLRAKVPMLPVQLWQSSGKSWFDIITDTVWAVLAGTTPPPVMTYQPPHLERDGGRYLIHDDGSVEDTLPQDAN